MGEDYYCETHELKTPAYEDTADPHCPYCREERRIEGERQHLMTRDPTLEPY